MPGARLAGYWEGSRAELLASYVLSSVAAVVPVPYQFDFGLDLLCTLTRHEDRLLYAGQAFGTQVKSLSAPNPSYGGLNDKGEWKKYELEWLFGQQQPILLCVVDQSNWTLRIYSTMRMWWVPYQIGWPAQVTLCPDREPPSPEPADRLARYSRSRIVPAGVAGDCGDCHSYEIPLGKPLVEIKPLEQRSSEYRDYLRGCLGPWISLEYRNIIHHRMGTPYFEEWIDWRPNTPPGPAAKYWHFWNTTVDQNIGGLLQALKPLMISLLYNLHYQGRRGKVEQLVRAFSLLLNAGLLDSAVEELLAEYSE